ncbi:ribosome-inactivating family protein [Streptomyces sp. MA5143a]|uniref:ribosome-inactivating family protein n=1 Tax=Streptomyces sp. MA5143a TaxID=2083010 RepID=UPI000D1B115A|nr:ribosome-inactivating family protein [Streptomyces sp. MA5143a]SPF04838.1 Ribosome inactivating protein [Streptomyces sp. MA5143a]
MPTSVTIVVALSVLLGLLVIIHAWMGTDDVDLPQVRWQLDRGSGAYLDMLDRLRSLAETPADGSTTPDVDTRRFADVVISGGNHTPTAHALVRLSDFRVVRFSVGGTPHGVVLNLASGIPDKEDATDDNWFLGKEGYDDLARVANQSLTDVDLGWFSLEQSLRDLGVRGTDRTTQASGMLRYSIAITAASRFRPIADHIAGGMDKGSPVFVTAQQVGLMRG